MKNKNFNYRKEIDGLRAVAVLPVVFYHAGINFFSGGYVGVDVFFVISGYLITSIILSDIKDKKFSIKGFYERRARRILPALFIVSLVTIPFGLYIFKGVYLLEFVQSLVSLIFFSSNFLFWSTGGYFSTATELKPLIHTWSLSVEEQYYIIFPFLFLMFINYFKSHIKLFFLILLFISFGFCIWGSYHLPNATFYLLPFRGWEIILGVMCALILNEKKIKFNKNINEILSIAGVIMIFGSIIFFDSRTSFPSFSALVPTIGTVLLILFCQKNTILYKFLTFNFLVYLGLFSYSIYLWHQPIFAFTKFVFLDGVDYLFTVIIILISILISYFSWKFIEKPFRNKKIIKFKYLLSFIIFSSLCFVFTWAYVIKFSDLSDLVSKSSKDWQKPFINKVEFFNPKIFEKDSENVFYESIRPKDKKIRYKILVLGDSHAQMYKEMGKYFSDKYDLEWHSYIFQGCPPIFGFYKIYDIEQSVESKKQKECRSQIKKWESFIRDPNNNFDFIILATRWNYIFNHSKYQNLQHRKDALVANDLPFVKKGNLLETSRKNFLKGLNRTVSIINNSGGKVIFFSQPPLLIRNPVRCFSLGKITYDNCANAKYKNIMERGEFIRSSIINEKLFDNKKNFSLILEDYLCNSQNRKCISKFQDKLLYSDDDHLSEYGAFYISKEWEKKKFFPFQFEK